MMGALAKLKNLKVTKWVGRLVNVFRPSGFANWHILKLDSRTPTEAVRQHLCIDNGWDDQ